MSDAEFDRPAATHAARCYEVSTGIPCRVLGPEHAGSKEWSWAEQAATLDGPSVKVAPDGATSWTVAIMTGRRVVGAFVAGPVVANERIAALANLLHILGHSVSTESRVDEFTQELERHRLESGESPESPSYPIAVEQSLLGAIRAGDVAGAQALLNELLGHVFFASGSDLPSIKYRTRELIVLLSRAAIDEGADPEQIFGLNYRFVDMLERQEELNRVAYWMSRIVRRFAELVLYLPNVAHATVLRKAIAYVRHHIAEPIRVATVAEHVGLSPTYFSRLFRSEMRETFVGYVNRTRIDRARDLLRTSDLPVTDIAARTGFADHSYFTKVFRESVGSTPSEFRSSS